MSPADKIRTLNTLSDKLRDCLNYVDWLLCGRSPTYQNSFDF